MKKRFFVSIIFCSFILFPYLANAADMYLVLDKAQVTAGSTFSGTVYISTNEVKVNNAEGNLFFPTDLISVDSVTTANSTFNIWIEQPTFSNSSGMISFNGGLPNPGYSGQAGNILKVNFRAKKSGTADLSFGSSAIRANDGLGTNVFSQARGATIAISDAIQVPVIAPVLAVDLAPKAPVITSADMPDENAWYNKTSGLFAWGLPADVTSVQLVLSRSSATAPSVMYDPPIKNKLLSDLAEGTLFLNARFKNSVGWSNIASRKINIDITNPSQLSVKTSSTENDLVAIEASAKDALSGVKNFVAYIDGKKVSEGTADKDSQAVFTLPPINAGDTDLEIRAYDKAGNYEKTSLTVDAPETKAPKITHYPEYIKVGNKIEIRGKAPYENVDINIWIKENGKDAKNYLAKPDEDKIFSYTSDIIETAGTVAVWAETIREGGIKSQPSEKVYVSVKESEALWLGTKAVQIISIAIAFLILLFALLALIYLGIRKTLMLRKKLKKDLLHTEQDIHKVFEILRNDTKRYLKILEKASAKRKLTKEESKIFDELTEDLNETEEYLEKKIKDIEENDL